MNNAGIYLRVSTNRQDEANQEPDCLRICAARGWNPVVFREQESAVKHRPEWERLKQSVHRGELSAVVVWALDRAGRDRVQLSHDIAELVRKGAAVVSVRESWLDQPAGPMRDLLIQLMGWFAQTERARLIERTKAGQERARAMGKRIGRPGLPDEKLRAARAAFDCGLSAFRAAKKVNVPETTLRGYWRQWSGFNSYPGHPRKVSAGTGA
jgi:DNA invertase Pin-like site-specific DNA recombinase